MAPLGGIFADLFPSFAMRTRKSPRRGWGFNRLWEAHNARAFGPSERDDVDAIFRRA